MGSWPNMADGKLPLSPGLPTTTQGLSRHPGFTCGWQRHTCCEACAGTGAASVHTSPSVSQLLPSSSSVLPGLGCGQRAPRYILISSQNWVTGSESGIRMAVTRRHFQQPHLTPAQPCWWENLPSAEPPAMGCWEKLLLISLCKESEIFLFMTKWPVWPFPSSVQEDIKIKTIEDE